MVVNPFLHSYSIVNEVLIYFVIAISQKYCILKYFMPLWSVAPLEKEALIVALC